MDICPGCESGNPCGWHRRAQTLCCMDELVALERAGWDALCTLEGAQFYDALLADDAVMLFPMGLFDPRRIITGNPGKPLLGPRISFMGCK